MQSLNYNHKLQSAPKIERFLNNSFVCKPDLNGWEAIYSPYTFHCRNIHAFDYRVLTTDPDGCYIIQTCCVILIQWSINTTF